MRMTPSLLIRQLVRTVHTHIRVEEDISAVPADELRTSLNEHIAIRDAIAAGDPESRTRNDGAAYCGCVGAAEQCTQQPRRRIDR